VPDFRLEDACHGLVAGVDEAGRGPLAGPVVAAAVCFSGRTLPPSIRRLIDDSKKLTAARREEAFEAILSTGAVATGQASVAEIDQMNILQATMTAMQRAVAGLDRMPDIVLVDGNRAPDLPADCRAVVKGDSISLSIAAASIIAKVTRDRIMMCLAADYPAYGWERNAGYGVAAHMAALETHGPTPHHRRSFAPIRNLLSHGNINPQHIE